MANIAADTFTGTDGTGIVSHDANWAAVTGYSDNAAIYSNRLRKSSGSTTAVYRYNVAPSSADYAVSSEFYVAGTTDTTYNAGVIARASSSQTTMYMARWRNGTGFQLFKFVNSTTATQIGSTVAQSYSAGTTQKITLRVEGSTISVYRGAETTPIISVTDTAISAAGYAGVWTNTLSTTDGPQLDNWSADDIVVNAAADGGTGSSTGTGTGGDATGAGGATDGVAAGGTGSSTGSATGGAAAGLSETFTVKANAVWTWFTDPRAVSHNGSTYVGWVDSSGNVGITQINESTRTATSFTLHAALEVDDHDNVAIHIRTDGRILAIYSKHNDTSGIRYRISTNAEDISAWGTEVVLSAGITLPVSYSNPFYLSQSGKIYNYFRSGPGGVGTNPIGMIESADQGATWSNPQFNFLTSTNERPYSKWVSNGVDRIDRVTTNCHPNENAASIYHFYGKLDGSNVMQYYTSDGTLIGTSLTPSNATQIYDGTTNDAWVWDIAYGADGHPRVLFVKYVTTSDHRYMYSRWTGSAWTTPVEITTGGGYLYLAEAYYSRGLCFDAIDPDHVYLSRPESGVGELQEWHTTDNGATWNKIRDITTGTAAGTINARPYSPRNRADELGVLWWSGTYTSYTSYSTDVVGAPASFSGPVSAVADGGTGTSAGSGTGGNATGAAGGDAVADGGTGSSTGSGTGGTATGGSGAVATIARPSSDISSSGWSASSGADLFAMLDEVTPDDADYIIASTVGAVCEIGLSAVADPGTSSGQVMRYRLWSPTGNGATVKLKQGATTIATWTHATLPTTATLYTQALTAGECDAITNYSALSIEVTST